MSTALCVPSASSHSVFQKMPGRRSTHGAFSVSAKKLTGVVAMRHLLWGLGRARLPERVTDGVAKSLDGLRALEGPPVHEKGRRAPQLEGQAFLDVRFDVRAELMRVEAGGEALAIEAQARRVAHEIAAREVRHREIEQIVIWPERALGRRTARRLRGGEGTLVGRHGEVLVDEADLAVELPQDLLEGRSRALAGRALEVGELDDDDRRVHG